MLLVIFSYVLVRHANTRPGYDPYGWLIWGYHTLHLSLDLGGAPSWKPLPYLFTVPMALFGSHPLTLWMTFATAVTLSGSIFAGRIAYRLTLPAEGPIDDYTRWSAIAAGVFAGLALLGIQTWVHLFLSAQSDTMIVSLCLARSTCTSAVPPVGVRVPRPGRARPTRSRGRSRGCTSSGRGARFRRCGSSSSASC